MGEMALRCLLYLGERHPEIARRLIQGQRQERRDYPFAAAFMNLVALVAELGGISLDRKPSPCVVDHGCGLLCARRHRVVPVNMDESMWCSPVYRLMARCDPDEHVFQEMLCAIAIALDNAWVRLGAKYMVRVSSYCALLDPPRVRRLWGGRTSRR
ncbi:MAG: hypothetical protein MHM6MM_003752 [Cercozoa sp. M6MM]